MSEVSEWGVGGDGGNDGSLAGDAEADGDSWQSRDSDCGAGFDFEVEFAEPQAGDAELLSRLGGGSATTGGAADPKAISFVGHQLQLQDFVEAIAEGRAPQVDGREGRRSVEVILGAVSSGDNGDQCEAVTD